MRIGVDVRGLQGGSGVRGIGRAIVELVEGLLALAPQHTVVLFRFAELPWPEHYNHLLRQCEVVDLPPLVPGRFTLDWRAIPFVVRGRVAMHMRNHNLWFRRQGASLAEAVNRAKVDVFHVPSLFEDTLSCEGRYNCPTVVTFHDAIPMVFKEEKAYFDEANPFHIQAYFRCAAQLKQFDRVVAISQNSADDAVKHFQVDPSRITVIPCAVSPEFADSVPSERVSEVMADLKITAPYFLFCSALDPHKNAKRLVEAFAQFTRGVPDMAHLVCVCSKQDPHLPEVDQVRQELGLEPEQVIYTGWVADDAFRALLQHAIAVVVPSLYEGFGLPAAQAMMAGTPVVSSNAASLPEVVGEAAILFAPTDIEAMGRAMADVLDAEIQKRLVEAGHAQVQQFSRERLVRNHLKLYQSLTTPIP